MMRSGAFLTKFDTFCDHMFVVENGQSNEFITLVNIKS